ncbi:(p)ppGpp synthetase [Vibrio neptunius]|uniref:GTP pyrophosphokinase n=1 Tax=Vibrio neptunius TaxID=170651 RepID=UPI0005F9B548|nr:(p)ppGpp synthetase [Vibrio neptunius]KJY93960.1 (p)ppGpp synthetase [Vibrio neptunius]
MNQTDFLTQWHEEKPMYSAWGEFVTSEIRSQLESEGHDLSSYLKQPVYPRVKSDESLIDKAFYRPEKSYDDPYNDIEDKVGARFVVLLLDQIEEISRIIKSSQDWMFKECRHFENERNRDPLLFTYQSVHYVVRASQTFEYKGITISKDTPCEIQVRTLLQHAYAELTHDAIYKAKRVVEPKVHRTVAKSMALIETTDDFFANVNNSLNNGAIEEFCVKDSLDKLYTQFVGREAMPMQKSALVVLDEFEDLVDEEFASKVERLLIQKPFIIDAIQAKDTDPFFQQSIAIFVSWLVVKKTSRLSTGWPLDRKIIQSLATDLSVSLDH